MQKYTFQKLFLVLVQILVYLSHTLIRVEIEKKSFSKHQLKPNSFFSEETNIYSRHKSWTLNVG